jgi:hypothetical protein
VDVEEACSRGGTKWPEGFDAKAAGVKGANRCSDPLWSYLIPGDP